MSHRIRSTSSSSDDQPQGELSQLALPELSSPPAEKGAGPAAKPRVSNRTRRAPVARRRGQDDQRQALQLALELAEQSVAEDEDEGSSAIEAARRAAMKRSREALRARLKLVPPPNDAARDTAESAAYTSIDSMDSDSMGSSMETVVQRDEVVDSIEASEVVFVGRLPPKGAQHVAELVADHLSLPPPRSRFSYPRSISGGTSGAALFEHRTAGAWLRISRVSSGLHVQLAGEARSRWLSGIRAAVRELGLVEAE